MTLEHQRAGIRSVDQIARAELAERVEQLEAALKPFAEFYGPHLAGIATHFPLTPRTHGHGIKGPIITAGDVRRAYSVFHRLGTALVP